MADKKLLDLSQPFCTRRQRLTLLSKTIDGKGLVFERPDSSGVFKTDLYGFITDDAPVAFVYNGYPEQFSKARHRGQYAIGDVVFYIRPMAKQRKIMVGKVERVEKDGVVLSLYDTYGLKQIRRQQADGTYLAPFNFVYKTVDAIEGFVESFQADLDRAMTTYRTTKRELAPVAQSIPTVVRRRGRPKAHPMVATL